MSHRLVGVLVVGLAGLSLIVGLYLWPGPAGPSPVPHNELAAGPAKPQPDRLGLTAAFGPELRRVGQISPRQFADRYPAPAYGAGLSWDPTAAQFFDRVNAEKVTKEHQGQKLELPGYKLTADELARFKANGFVVSERLGGYSFGQLYYDVYNRDLPVFVTSDSVLHAWHRSYDAVLMDLELTYLTPALDAILTGMHEAVPGARARYGDGVLADAVRDADYFLAVARSLLGGPVPTKLGQDERRNKTLVAVSRLGMEEFDLFGRRRSMDFSQFKPRGHYESHPELPRYFRAMMWCGRTDLRVAGGADATGPLSSPRELGAAVVLLDLLRTSGREKDWRQFDRLLQTFVGRTDSATFDDLARVAAAADVRSPADLKTEADLDRLTAVVKKSDAGRQEIRGEVYWSDPDSAAQVELPHSFTLLGQKFALDSWVTSKLVYDDVLWDGEKVKRRIPSGLDVAFAALGNDHVVPELVGRMEGGPRTFRDRLPYQHQLAAARNTIDRSDAKARDETIYTAWLKTLRTLARPADDGQPAAVRSRAWAMKQTNTQLASWAQLRHDTLLYVKQSYTAGASCYYPAGYVEPVVPFWAQMEAMAGRAADLLERTPFPPANRDTQAKQVAFLRNFAARMARVKAVAEKQLARKELTADERKVLEDVMQIGHQRAGSATVPHYTGWYPSLFYNGPEDCMKWDALVADVHTDTPDVPDGDPGCVLHQGVGGVDLMVIAIDNGTDRVAYVGPTLSHYEFETPLAVRKTDAEWKADLLDGKAPPRPTWTKGYLVPRIGPPAVDAYTRNRLLAE
jgi:hypothetical protein